MVAVTPKPHRSETMIENIKFVVIYIGIVSHSRVS